MTMEEILEEEYPDVWVNSKFPLEIVLSSPTSTKEVVSAAEKWKNIVKSKPHIKLLDIILKIRLNRLVNVS